MQKLILWCVCLIVSFRLVAQNEERYPVLEDPPKKPFIEETRNPNLIVYVPEKPNGTGIIICPGGGYSRVGTWTGGGRVCEWLNKIGITGIVVNYRLPQGDCTKPISDVQEAFRIVRKNAVRWGIDPVRIGIWGESAGGHLASVIATHYECPEARPAFQILLSPVITLEAGKTHAATRNNFLGSDDSQERAELYSSHLQVTENTPPAFIAVDKDDQSVPSLNSVLYYRALQEKGVEAELMINEGSAHGFSVKATYAHYEELVSGIQAFISKRTEAESVTR